MKTKLLCLIVFLAVAPLLAGCGGGGGAGLSGLFGIGGSSSDGSILASLAEGGGSVLGGGADPVVSGSAHHNPEPATMALFGTGLFAYGLLKRKKRK